MRSCWGRRLSITVKFRIKSNKTAQALAAKRKQVSEVVRKTALDIEGDAKSLAPVRTGHLKNSIQAESMQPGDVMTKVTVGAEYGGHVELGTKRMAAQPYLTPAVERHRSAFFNLLRRILFTR